MDSRIAGERWVPSGYVFTYQIGTPLEPNELHKQFDRLVERLALPAIRLHDLRHT